MHGRVALFLCASVVVIGTAQAAVVEKTKFKGTQVATSFSADASITCANGSAGTASTSGFLSGSSQMTRSLGSPKTVNNGIFMEVSYSNSCTGVSVSFADGGIANGLTPPKKNLDSAALDGTGLVQDFGSGAQVSVTLEIDVAGTGPILSGGGTTHTRTVQTPNGPVTITITHSANGSRQGIASGTITVEGVVFNPTFSLTDMSFNRNSEIVIEHP